MIVRPSLDCAGARFLVAACLAGVAVGAHAGFARVPVSVDGEQLSTHPGATVEEVAQSRIQAACGDLVAATDSRVLVRGGGEPASVERNGVCASASDCIKPGDTLRIIPGKDVVEATQERLEAIPIPTKIVGTGAIVTLAAPGTAGIKRVVFGAVSGDVVTSQTVRPAEPMVLRRAIDRRKKRVALTFDDGPWPRQTDAVLSILAEEGVPATFFVIGRQVRAHPEIVRRVARAGHAIGNHTYHHVNLTGAAAERAREEVAGTSRAIRSAAGITPRWLRPPGGAMDADAYEIIAEEGLRVALWTVDPQDWRKGMTAARIEAEVLKTVRPGAVILLHDGGGDRTQTLAALPGIIRKLRAQGYEFVPLADLGAIKAAW